MAGETEVDYIICGGGTCGCVVASRLAEDPNITVLIEAGENCLDVENSIMTGGMVNLIGSSHDWNLSSTAQPNANDRAIPLPRGKFLGGSSGSNGTICMRGTKQDYDDWNVPGWSGEEMFRAMKKAENFHGKEWFKGEKEAHGYDGPVDIEPHDLAAISERLLESFQDMGLPLDHDMFSTGEHAHGCGHATRTVYKGMRTTAAQYTRGWEEKENFTILFKSCVSKVNMKQTISGLQATSVDIITSEGDCKTYTARQEIILSAGTYHTPTILMRSCIGPKDELAKQNITCLVDLPGVGQNLQDHLIVFLPYEVKPDLTHDDKIHPPENLAKTYEEWVTNKTGFLSSFPFGVVAFARLDNQLEHIPEWTLAQQHSPPGRDPMGLTTSQPHIELFTTECCAGPAELPPPNGKHAFAIITQLFAPRSRGSVTLSSADPFADPIIDPHYLEDDLDVLVLTESVRWSNDIVMNGRGTRDIVLDSYPSNSQHHLFTTRAQWTDFVKANATTCHHPVGTCKMGTIPIHTNNTEGGIVDENVVVDEKLRVRGVKGLRVVDCSVMPKIPGAHTCMPAYGVAETGVEVLREDMLNVC